VTVLIDPPRWPAHGRLYSHLVSDTSFAELHAFAAAQGLPERAFDRDHYDVPADRYPSLVAAGALPVESRELLARLIGAGLRRRKRSAGRPADAAENARPNGPPAGAPVTAHHHAADPASATRHASNPTVSDHQAADDRAR
jgi:hypothetical protein